MSKFIKVTPKGEKTSHIVLATLKNFYISQGAKVEIPTDEEIFQAEPNERQSRPVAEADEATKQIKNDLKEALAIIKEKDATIEEQAQALADLREKLAATEVAVTESEKVIEGLRKELAATEKKSTKQKQ